MTARTATYADYRDQDLAAIKRFVQSNASYKSSRYETVKWGAYDAYARITGESALDLPTLVSLLDSFGISYRPSTRARLALDHYAMRAGAGS